MTDRRMAALRVGIAVVVATVGLVAGLAWVKQWSVRKGTYDVSVHYEDVAGLTQGDPVWVNGVEKGKIKKVELAGQQGVTVDLRLQSDVTLYDDATATIRGSGLMGEKYVAVDPGRSGVKVPPGGHIKGALEPDMGVLMADAGAALADVKESAERLNKILAYLGDGTLQRTVSNINRTSEEVNAIAAENRRDLHVAVSSFRDSAERLKAFIDAHSGEVDTTLTTARAAADRLDRLTSMLETITNRIESGQGTLGKLVNDDQLHDDLQRTVAAADSLVRDLKTHPGRYLRFSVF